jgi:DNA-binding NarL/FixJ family response regulator
VIGVKTVERDRQSMLDKVGMRDRVELTRYAIRRRLTHARPGRWVLGRR